MEAMSIFGFFAFIFSVALGARVRWLEQLLRENGIRPTGSKDLARRLAGMAGQKVALTLYTEHWQWGNTLSCRVLDTDETWALVLADEGKKKEREMLIRLDSVKSIKG